MKFISIGALRACAVIFIAFGLDFPAALAGGTHQAVTDPHPAIWLLSDSDTRIFLFGTNHILPGSLNWRSAHFEAVVEAAEELVLETADDGLENKQERMAQLMMLDEPISILERVAPEYRSNLRYVIKYSGISRAAFDRMATWAVALTIMTPRPEDTLDGEPLGDEISGVEIQLTEEFTASERPISGLETSFEQIDFFRGLSEAGQSRFLESVVGQARIEELDESESLLSMWLNGNVDGVGEVCDSEEEFSPELREALLRQRNIRWTEWLIRRLEDPGTVLFAVGACHLAGEISVLAMLEARNIEVERLE